MGYCVSKSCSTSNRIMVVANLHEMFGRLMGLFRLIPGLQGLSQQIRFCFSLNDGFRLLHVCDSMQSNSNALQGSSNSGYARWFRSGLRRGLRQLAIRSPLRLLRLWLRGWFDPPKPLTVVALVFCVASSIRCLFDIG